MPRFFYASIFLLKNYQRNTLFIWEWLIFGIFIGIIFDPRFVPYTTEYVILAKSIFLVIIAVVISFRFTKTQYKSQLSVILNRISRVDYYIISVFSSLGLAVMFSILLDLYLFLIIKTDLKVLLNYQLLLSNFLILVMSVLVAHIFSAYITKNILFRFLVSVVIGLGATPNWFSNLPFTWVFQSSSYLLPPIGLNIINLLENKFSVGLISYSFLYCLAVFFFGIFLFKKRSLSDLS